VSRFFRNRSLLIKPVKDNDYLNGDSPLIETIMTPEVAAAYSEVAKDFITHTALTIGAVFITCKIVERLTR
jgi:hypothetical protein